MDEELSARHEITAKISSGDGGEWKLTAAIKTYHPERTTSEGVEQAELPFQLQELTAET